MKTIFALILFLLLLPSSLFAACGDPGDPCKQCTGQGTISATTSGTLSFGTLPTVGNTIKLVLAPFAFVDLNSNNSAITDNQSGNSYAVNTSARIVATTTQNRVEIYSGVVVGSTGTFTLTWGIGGASFTGVWMACEIQLLDSSSYDRHGTQETLSNTSITATATAANSQANEFVLVLMYNNGGGGGASTPSGYTQLFLDNTTIGAEAAYKVVSAGETSSATWNYSSGDSLGVLTTDKYTPAVTAVARRSPDHPRTGSRTPQ